jgi:hypothetical protein
MKIEFELKAGDASNSERTSLIVSRYNDDGPDTVFLYMKNGDQIADGEMSLEQLISALTALRSVK